MSLFQRFNIDLGRVLLDASKACPLQHEEEGGIILKRKDEYQFVKVINLHRGTHTAYGLYVAEPAGFGSEVVPLLSKGWQMYASFHTHPQFSCTPSQLDHDKLFQGFKYNYIYSHRDLEFSCSDWSPSKDLYTVKINLETLIYYTLS